MGRVRSSISFFLGSNGEYCDEFGPLKICTKRRERTSAEAGRIWMFLKTTEGDTKLLRCPQRKGFNLLAACSDGNGVLFSECRSSNVDVGLR